MEAVSRINELMHKAYVTGQPKEVVEAYQKARNALMSCRVVKERHHGNDIKVIITDDLFQN